MPAHHTPLVSMIAIGLVLAFLLGLVSHRLRVSPLVGYLLAGIIVGPFTPGFVANQALANELAEIGVILLMFAVGLHFSLKDLLSVRAVALPGAVVQIGVATLLGMALAWALGWPVGAGIVFGLALSVASTVVLIRALQERRIIDTDRGRIAVGWLIVEDLAMVLVLVMLPALAGALSGAGETPDWYAIAVSAGLTLVKVATFVAIMLIAGRRVVPWIMHYAAHTGSRELFRLSVYAVALGIAYGAAALFGVSFALGAFFAGMVLAESPLSQRATEEALPLRDAFAVLFFVSVGMLFDPGVLVRSPWSVLATVAIIVIGKSIAAYSIVRLFGRSNGTALTISASLAQIGEFSFILAGLGVGMGVLPQEGRDLILAGAIISILLNPLIFAAVDRPRSRKAPDRTLLTSAGDNAVPAADEAVGAAVPDAVADLTPTSLTGHDVLVGYGRVGSLVGSGLRAAGRPVLVFEERADEIEAARRDGAEVVVGNAADPEILATANLPGARRLIVTVPEAFEAGQVVEQARAANPDLEIVARAHTDAAVEHLTDLGASLAVMGEREIAMRILERIEHDDEAAGVRPQAGGGPADPTAD
ncbi:Kef family K(+) transporter [Skermanella rosea]|uniref:YbaL family putative K(+) efflux transporter n=1 Tax=Skermanella rosea TaxID=1817965 RepID=UPI001E47615E|nr:YbaL family putative K(+) efflux transporter [Skermanella rosea]UEM04618.1 Kef family K(+) transporter [Skermanella rosea]